ncbi:MAG: sulfurtransferase [Propionicimonas sp.]|uniref:sulfurtransferase n=1 Tax=Propionicimonas sp. TaxID=1955623 RepID=UPI002B1EEFAE|nr:sulfurtransferase [Propionicimonas sp.]MEA4945877.1 sulfurtransferase [Propionicimonas sp.]MEA5052742.1 sulfurtransferase [Propionicimonas sp.]
MEQATDPRTRVLISVDEVLARLDAPAAPQLLDVRWRLGEVAGSGLERYRQRHLPGARFLDLEAVLTGPHTDPRQGRHPLPSPEQVAHGLGELGIDPGREIVVYDEPGSFAAGRAWWVLRWLGLNARVLDGGLTAWQAAGAPLQTGLPEPAVPSRIGPLTAGHLATLTADQVALFEGTLIDVRAPERYRGETEPIDARAGHIPEAVNRPVSGFWDDRGQLPGQATLRGRLDLTEDRPVAVYCGSGISAAQVVLALASLGIDAALYPPSWSGWSSDPDRPVAVGQ